MKQSSLGLGTSTKRTRRREFLDEMDRVVPWSDLVAQIAPFMPEGKRGRPPFPVESLLRIHFCMYGPDAFCKPLSSDDQRSAHMYSACLLGNACASPQP